MIDHVYQLAHTTIASCANVQADRRALPGCSRRSVLLDFAHVHFLNRAYTVILDN